LGYIWISGYSILKALFGIWFQDLDLLSGFGFAHLEIGFTFRIWPVTFRIGLFATSQYYSAANWIANNIPILAFSHDCNIICNSQYYSELLGG
jgi:hypothetical protein